MLRNSELYTIIKQNNSNSAYDKLLCVKCADIVLRCNFPKHKKKEKHIINHLDKEHYEDKIEKVKENYKRDKERKRTAYIDDDFFNNLEKKEKYYNRKKKKDDTDDDISFDEDLNLVNLDDIDNEMYNYLVRLKIYLGLLPLNKQVQTDLFYLNNLLSDNDTNKEIINNILDRYDTFI